MLRLMIALPLLISGPLFAAQGPATFPANTSSAVKPILGRLNQLVLKKRRFP